MAAIYTAFDIESYKEFPSGADWHTYAPLGISCAATYTFGQPKPEIFYNVVEYANGAPMGGDELMDLLKHLERVVDLGGTIVTWNGTYDFENLAIETGEAARCAELARNSWDIMYQLFCVKGYPLALNTAALGMGLPGKTEGMHGDLAPVMWKESEEKRDKVLEYVGQDVITTLNVALAVLQNGALEWVSKSGKRMRVPMRPHTVHDCMSFPDPDNSWMDNPIPKSSFYGWVVQERLEQLEKVMPRIDWD